MSGLPISSCGFKSGIGFSSSPSVEVKGRIKKVRSRDADINDILFKIDLLIHDDSQLINSLIIVFIFRPSFPRRRESNVSENGCPTKNLGHDG